MAEMKYLLDTSICIELLKGNAVVRQHSIDNAPVSAISTFTITELLYGAYNAPLQYQEKELSKARMLIDYYPHVGVDEIPDAFCLEKLRLKRAGLLIEDFDLLIGMTAKVNNLVMVTHNRKHMERIEGLKIADWCI